ncbi:MAG: hypothetical protein KAJ46_03915, partial [Sedimentisphaerales bacterium]|nr:hypothetical protein [Sedimentisphaerales bacterium]
LYRDKKINNYYSVTQGVALDARQDRFALSAALRAGLFRSGQTLPGFKTVDCRNSSGGLPRLCDLSALWA